MADPSLNQYEKRLYSVFKTFDVDNEEALNRAAVVALCDALQLEQRGAALVDTLFERRDQRVTFAQFRSGLLAVLGDSPPPPPPTLSVPPPGTSDAAHSDDDSSGREVAPKFVFGSKKYGRRSRPSRGRAPPASPSPTPDNPEVDLDLDHSSVVDCERALQLCRRLRMDGIDRRLVQHIFESVPTGETTVGEFFDRLNASLTMSINNPSDSGPSDEQDEEALPTELIVDAWERAGVQKPRRLLTELGFEGAAVPAAILDHVLDEEARALPDPTDARALLLLAALTLARLRRERAISNATEAAAERDRLRADLDEANRRARLLAQDVDENHARLEAERATSLRRAETRHAETLKALEIERNAERERAIIERCQLENELARRTELEQTARVEAEVLRKRCDELEARVAKAEEQRAIAERERDRLNDALTEMEERVAAVEALNLIEKEAAEVRVSELRSESALLRDRCDELAAQLEARPPSHPHLHLHPPHSCTWLHESAGSTLLAISHAQLETESPPVSLDPPVIPAVVTSLLTPETAASTLDAATMTSDTPTVTSEASTMTSESLVVTLEAATMTSDTPVVTAKTPVVTSEMATMTSETPVVTAETPVVTSEMATMTSDTPVVTSEAATMTSETPVVTSEMLVVTSEAATQATSDEAAAVRAQLLEAEVKHAEECNRLQELVKELETSLELLREEYERTEDYWGGKLAEERALLAAEQKASDERLAQLANKITEYEKQFAPTRLPSVIEVPALETQAAELDATAVELKRKEEEIRRLQTEMEQRESVLQRRDVQLKQREAEARRRYDELQRRDRHLARVAHMLETLRRQASTGNNSGVEAELRARAARAEAGAARLAARLAAADLLVKDLYVENCSLGPAPRHL